MSEIQTTAASLEVPADAGKGQSGVVTRWLKEIELADKTEESWRKAARETVDRYRDEVEGRINKRKGRSRFNVLWSNVQYLAPNLYSATPRPDVRRRFRDPDPLAKEISEIIERAATYTLDVYDFDHVMGLAVLDYVLPGRCVTRVRYNARNTDGEVVWESAECEHVQWDRFRHGPGATWDDVEWIAFEHLLTREEIDDKFPGSKVELDVELKGKDERNTTPDLFKRGRIWEVWHKPERKVLWIAPTQEFKPVKVEDDPLKLRKFFPVPRPCYAVTTSDSLVPIEEYRLYKDQAEELDEITHRIRRLVSACKYRGIYDSVLSEMGTLLESDDNLMLPSEGAQNILAATGTLERHIWVMPIEAIARTLAPLYVQRNEIKQIIYEITGLSDILRGATDPNETLGAQQLKAQSGNLRMQQRQREVQRYARDLIEMKVEIMAEHFAPETLSMMTGREVTAEGLQLLRNGGLRDYRIDIETDSTISIDQATDRENITRLLGSIGEYMTSFAPAVESGIMSVDAAKAILVESVRKFKFGRQVEDKLEDMGEQQGQQGPSPEEMQQMQEQMQQQIQQQLEQQMAGEREQVKAEATKVAAEKQGIQGEVQAAEGQLKAKEQEIGFKAREMELSAREREMDLVVRERKLELERAAHEVASKHYELGTTEDRITGLMTDAENQGLDVRPVNRIEEMNQDMKELAQAITALAQMLAQAQERSDEALRAAITAPKEIIRDSSGRVTGARTRLDS